MQAQALLEGAEILSHEVYATYRTKKGILKLYGENRHFWGSEAEVISILHRNYPEFPRLIMWDMSEPWEHILPDGEKMMVHQSILMEEIKGHKPKKGELTPKHKEQLEVQLKKMHRLGIVHGDVRRDNIIIRDEDGTACLIDYGESYSACNPKLLPPMPCLLEDGEDEAPTFMDDFRSLQHLF